MINFNQKFSHDILNWSDFSLIHMKSTGIEHGGIAVYGDSQQKFMMKQMDMTSTVAELVGARVARLIAGNAIPVVTLVTQSTGGINIASKFIDNFYTMYDYARIANIPMQCLPYGCIIRKDGSTVDINYYIVTALPVPENTLINFPNYEEVDLAIRLTNQRDDHLRNRGVIVSDGDPVLASIIDFSLSLSARTDYLYSKRRYDPIKMFAALEKLEKSLTPEKIQATLDHSFNQLQKICAKKNQAEYAVLKDSAQKVLFSRRKELLATQAEVKVEANVRRFVIAHQENNTKDYNNLLPLIEASIEKMNDHLKLSLMANIPEYARENVLLSTINNEAFLLDAMIECIQYENKKGFARLWPLITDDQALARLLYVAVDEGIPALVQMFSATITDQQVLGTALDRAMGYRLQEVESMTDLLYQPNVIYIEMILPGRSPEFKYSLLYSGSLRTGSIHYFLDIDNEDRINFQKDIEDLWHSLDAILSVIAKRGHARLVSKNNQKMIVHTLSEKITDQHALGEAVYAACRCNRKELYEILLSQAIDEQKVLAAGMMKAVDENQKIVVNILLPRMTDDLVLFTALQQALKKKHLEIATLLSAKIGDQPSQKVYPQVSIASDVNENNCKTISSDVTDQQFLVTAFNKAVNEDNIGMIDTLLPKIGGQFLKAAFSKAIDEGNINVINTLLPKIFFLEQEFLNEAFNQAFTKWDISMIKKLLPFTQQNTLVINTLKTLYWVSSYVPKFNFLPQAAAENVVFNARKNDHHKAKPNSYVAVNSAAFFRLSYFFIAIHTLELKFNTQKTISSTPILSAREVKNCWNSADFGSLFCKSNHALPIAYPSRVEKSSLRL